MLFPSPIDRLDMTREQAASLVECLLKRISQEPQRPAYVAELQGEPRYQELDVKAAYDGLEAKRGKNGKEPTKAALVRWLNKELDARNIPDWLPLESWQRWLKYNRERRKPLVASTIVEQFKDLEKYLAMGHEPDAVINQSIGRNWTGLFPIRINDYGQTTNGAAQTGSGSNYGRPSRTDIIRSRDYSVFAEPETGADPH